MTKIRKPKDPNKQKTSKYFGVSLATGAKKYVAQFKVNSKNTYLGSFLSEELAAREYDKALYSAMQNGLAPFKLSRLNFGIPATPIQQLNSTQSTSYNTAATSMNESWHSSKYRGVSWYEPRKHWKASIQLNCKKEYIGTFATAEEAANAYNDRIKRLADEVEDPDKKIKLLKRAYEVPNTITRYPQNYTKRIKLVRYEATDASTPVPTNIAPAGIIPMQEQVNLSPDFDIGAELDSLGLFNDLPTIAPPIREPASPLLFRSSSPDLLKQILYEDELSIFRSDSPSLRF